MVLPLLPVSHAGLRKRGKVAPAVAPRSAVGRTCPHCGLVDVVCDPHTSAALGCANYPGRSADAGVTRAHPTDAGAPRSDLGGRLLDIRC